MDVDWENVCKLKLSGFGGRKCDRSENAKEMAALCDGPIDLFDAGVDESAFPVEVIMDRYF